ncbi:Bug family tripartite tricarboxylate transporter substrate binding protein [Fusibacter ferrireducens]|uniref:Tripartite tricarboxylate transporter substrate binding protein n=1 Tax=Fusibacter ferrireducens TaxID=2785058 RepID=A0ABR9ZXF1_9FIRM|nr:tripartite tricarboxylate transporter substrate binding protein [Fusibacter ferrireducens]MBF4694279.1 tripartite tricarboxylate transporter substrate binding protein [Fusibacter ferrireducens]
MKHILRVVTLCLVMSVMAFLPGCSVESESPAQEKAADQTPAQENSEAAEKNTYPDRAITMIVPYGAGGGTDTYGRMLATQLEKHLNAQITVSNQSGASGSIGTKYVFDAPADGYTVLFAPETLGTYRTMGISDLSYDDFVPISVVVNDPKLVVVSKNSKYNTIEELLADIKANPGKVSMSHSGPGGSGHNQGLILKELGYDVAMTAFDGGTNALLGVIGEQVDFTNPNLSFTTGYIDSGDVKVLAVFSNERIAGLPDVPAFTEALPESEKYLNVPLTPLSLLVKKGTPEAVIEVLRKATLEAFEEEEWTSFVSGNQAEPLYKKYKTQEEIYDFYHSWQSMICWLQYENGVAKISPEEFKIEKYNE